MQKYEQQLEPEATHAVVPEEIHPVAAAFGGDIGKALEQGGDKIASTIQSLSVHMAKMNEARQKAQEAELLIKHKVALQNKTFGDPNDPNATVTAVNGKIIPPNLTFQPGEAPSNVAPQQTVEIPAGIYNRKGYAASGSLEDFDNAHHINSDQIIEEAKALGIKDIASLRTKLDLAWVSQRNTIGRHESTELNNAQQQTFFKNMQLDVDNAVTNQDPISLGRTIESIKLTNKTLNDTQLKPQDDPIREVTENQFVTKAINNSMVTNLKNNGGNPEQFSMMLDRLHKDGLVNDVVYENAQQNLSKVSTSMSRQNERVAKVDMLNTNMKFLQLAMTRKVDFTNPNILADISMRSPMAGEAISNYLENKDVDVDDKQEAFADATKKVAAFKTAEEFQTYAFNEMKKYPNGISQERFNILMAYGMKRSENIKQLQDESDRPSNPVQDSIDSAMHALLGWNKKQDKEDGQSYVDYMKAIGADAPASQAYSMAVANSAIRTNPTLTTIPINGQIRIDKYGQRAMVYPDGRIESIKGGKVNNGKQDGK